MKLKWITVVFALPLAFASCGQALDTQETSRIAEAPLADIAAEHPDKVKVAFQNEYLRVLRFDLNPNDALPSHSGKRRVVYSLSDYKLDWTTGTKASVSRSWSAGDTHGHDADVHALKNIGETKASFVVFERLEPPLPFAPGREDDSEMPTGAKSLLSNGDFHVLEVRLQPGESQALHEGGWRAIYSLSDYTIEWQEDEKVEQKSWSAGDVHWHEPAQHAAENAGDTEARWVVVELKN